MTEASATPGPRADMVRNRRRLLGAATAAFAERGVEVSTGEIAQRAGVAKGTVFRHFASKDDLLAAITLQILDQLIHTADRLLETDDAAEALREFMTAGVEVLAADRGSRVVGRPSLQHAEVRDAIDHLCDAAEALTARAREQATSAATSRGPASCCCSAASTRRRRPCSCRSRRPGAATSNWPSTGCAPPTPAPSRIPRPAASTSPTLVSPTAPPPTM